jgi:quinolinate synthase
MAALPLLDPGTVQVGQAFDEGSLSDIQERIQALKAEKDIVVLAHNYQYPEIQAVADIRGDSLELAIAATRVPQANIVFCGVDFMAETAKILNPAKRVFIPDAKAHCPMAAMTDVEGLRLAKERYRDAAIVAYVNTRADVKTVADVCCTSANAVNVVQNIEARTIIFTPDQNLGQYVARKVPDKQVVIWPGYCHVHQNMTAAQVQELQEAHPGAETLVHPECPPDVIDVADHVFSTSGMLKHCRQSPLSEFIVATEREITFGLKRDSPDKSFYVPARAVCPTHKKVTIHKVLATMESMGPEVLLDEATILAARGAVDRMVRFARRE